MAGRSRLNRFFVSEYSRTIKYFRVKVWVRIGSQSLLRQRILPDRGANYGTRFSIRSLNRFFVSEYSRTPVFEDGVYVGSLGLNRFFVSEYSRTDAVEEQIQRREERSQSLLRQRILPDL